MPRKYLLIFPIKHGTILRFDKNENQKIRDAFLVLYKVPFAVCSVAKR
jgi:hypothetical protein